MPELIDQRSPATTGEQPFTCPHCHSTRVRRSRPHGLGERLLRGTTSSHFFRCRDCGHRGIYRGLLFEREGGSFLLSRRRREKGEQRAPGRRKSRLLLTVALAVGLGALAGNYLHSCREPETPGEQGSP